MGIRINYVPILQSFRIDHSDENDNASRPITENVIGRLVKNKRAARAARFLEQFCLKKWQKITTFALLTIGSFSNHDGNGNNNATN